MKNMQSIYRSKLTRPSNFWQSVRDAISDNLFSFAVEKIRNKLINPQRVWVTFDEIKDLGDNPKKSTDNL